MTTTTNDSLLGPDGYPCEGCEGSSGLPPVTTMGYCSACEAAAARNYPNTFRSLVGTRVGEPLPPHTPPFRTL